MQKAWKTEFKEFLMGFYEPSIVDVKMFIKAIEKVDRFIKLHTTIGVKMLQIIETEKICQLKVTMLSHKRFAMGPSISANDPRVIVLDRYIEFLQIKAKQDTLSKSANPQTEDEIQQATEGLLKEVKYFRSKRNRAIRDQCAERDHYTCQVCGFNFEKVYGERGKKFIEVHHINPMANFDGEHEIKVEDLISLCSNCHSMIHYGGDFLDIDELRKTIKTSQDTIKGREI